MLADYGSQGIEASIQLKRDCGSAKELKARMDKYDIACANHCGGGDYDDPANRAKVRPTVEDNIGLAQDHITICGGHCLKVNLTMRDLTAHPVPGWWTTGRNGRACQNPE